MFLCLGGEHDVFLLSYAFILLYYLCDLIVHSGQRYVFILSDISIVFHNYMCVYANEM